MRVTHLSLSDFRNYGAAEVPLSKGLNLVIGRNGQGKTNLVEAIAYFSILGSHRVSSDAALIRAGCNSAVARLQVLVGEREALLEVQLNRDKPNRAQVNRNAVKPRELMRWFSAVVFAPEDLLLARGEPGVRRRFLDEAVVERNPMFSSVLSDYERVVRQRSALLKSVRGSVRNPAVESTLEIWDAQLIELGAKIMLARRSLVNALVEPLNASYRSIVEQDHHPRITLVESVTSEWERSGVSRETLEEQFAEALLSVRKQEFDRGVTLVGPHRDDALLELNHLPVKGYASHGETWSFALSLKLALASLLRAESPAGDPVIILDDVFAELDVRRRYALMSETEKYEQVIVTAAVEEDVPAGDWHRVRIRDGSVLGSDAL